MYSSWFWLRVCFVVSFILSTNTSTSNFGFDRLFRYTWFLLYQSKIGSFLKQSSAICAFKFCYKLKFLRLKWDSKPSQVFFGPNIHPLQNSPVLRIFEWHQVSFSQVLIKSFMTTKTTLPSSSPQKTMVQITEQKFPPIPQFQFPESTKANREHSHIVLLK